MKHLKLFENYDEPLFKEIDGNERHKLVSDKKYQDFDTSDIKYLQKEFWDDTLYNIIKAGPRSFEFWSKTKNWSIDKSNGDYEFKVYKISDEYFIVDTWFLPYGRNPHKKFMGHTLCDQVDGLVEFINNKTK